jgi:hypothetical protein
VLEARRTSINPDITQLCEQTLSSWTDFEKIYAWWTAGVTEETELRQRKNIVLKIQIKKMADNKKWGMFNPKVAWETVFHYFNARIHDSDKMRPRF